MTFDAHINSTQLKYKKA